MRVCLTGHLGQRDGRQKDGHMDGQIPPVLQAFAPFGAAALLLLNLNHVLLKQGTGTADHFLPLGCYCLCTGHVHDKTGAKM